MQPGYRVPLSLTHPWTEDPEALAWFFYFEGEMPPSQIARATGLRLWQIDQYIRAGHRRRAGNLPLETTTETSRRAA